MLQSNTQIIFRCKNQPAMCEVERLVRVLLFDNDQILLYNDGSVITNLIRIHLSTIYCNTEAEQRSSVVGSGLKARLQSSLGCGLKYDELVQRIVFASTGTTGESWPL